MAVGFLDVGKERIWLCSYNPASILTVLYADAIVGLAKERLRGMTRGEVHAWIKANIPNAGPIIDAVEQGREIPRDVPVGEYPVTPGMEIYEAPIASFLKGKHDGTD